MCCTVCTKCSFKSTVNINVADIKKFFECENGGGEGRGNYKGGYASCKRLVCIHRTCFIPMSDFLARVATRHNNPAPKEGEGGND